MGMPSSSAVVRTVSTMNVEAALVRQGFNRHYYSLVHGMTSGSRVTYGTLG